jgi:hypothetical protein
MEVKLSGIFKTSIPQTKIMLRLVEGHFPERIPPTENKAKPTRRCVVCYKIIEGRVQCFDAPNLKLPYVLKKVSRHSTESYIFKVRFYCIFKKLRHS